jgi:hypothetical protein
MSPTRIVSVINVVWPLWGARATAQTPWLAPESRIRVSLAAPVSQRLTGTVIALTADSLFFTPTHGVETIAISQRSILGLEMSRGRRSVGKGALVGGFAGLSVGATAVFIAAIADGCLNMDWSYGAGHCPTDATAMGIAFGAGAVGAVIGSLVRPERWVRMPLGGVHASLTPTGVRLAIGI